MNHQQIANLIASTGADVTYLVTGEPGIGKSDLLKRLSTILPKHEPIYVDCPTLDLPDVQLPYVEAGTARFATNAMWGVDNPRPKLIMLDELPKSSNVTRLLFTRLLLDHVIGAYALPAGSIVFATGNRTVDGVGDSFPAHMNNRVTSVQLDKPTAESWLEWADTAGIDPVLKAWVNQFPHCMAEANSPQNPYVFDTKHRTTSFVSPRSLAKASHIIAARSQLGKDTTHAALAGTLGDSAAADIATYIDLANQLPSWDMIMRDPQGAPIPSAVPAQLIIAYGMADRVKAVSKKDFKDTVQALVEYGRRLHLEVAAVAFSGLVKASVMSVTVPALQQWAKENSWSLK